MNIHFFLLSFFVLIASFFSQGFLHPDEHFQLYEYSTFVEGIKPLANMPWEYEAKMRPWLLPLFFTFFKGVFNFFSESAVYAQMFFRLFWGFCGVIVAVTLFKREEKKNSHYWNQILVFSWFLPFLFVRTSAESIAAILIGLSIILIKEKRVSLLAGFILGISFVIRFQLGFTLVGVGLWCLFIKKDFKSFFLLCLGFLVANVIGFGADFLGYQEATIPAYNYFIENIVNDKASQWGTTPWYYYLKDLLKYAHPPHAILFTSAILYFLYKKPKSLLGWIFVPFFLAHLAVGHKEFRFMFPMLFPVLLMSVYTLRQVSFEKIPYVVRSWAKGIIIIFNFLMLAYSITKVAHPAGSFYRFAETNEVNYMVYHQSKDHPYFLADLKIDYFFQGRQKLQFVQDSHRKSRGTLLTYRLPSKEKHCEILWSERPEWMTKLKIWTGLFKNKKQWVLWDCK